MHQKGPRAKQGLKTCDTVRVSSDLQKGLMSTGKESAEKTLTLLCIKRSAFKTQNLTYRQRFWDKEMRHKWNTGTKETFAHLWVSLKPEIAIARKGKICACLTLMDVTGQKSWSFCRPGTIAPSHGCNHTATSQSTVLTSQVQHVMFYKTETVNCIVPASDFLFSNIHLNKCIECLSIAHLCLLSIL